METFVVVVKSGSLSRAADVLHLTQPGVSKRIRHVEEEFGCRLFERVGNQFLLTREGQMVYAHVEGMLNAMNELRQRLAVEAGRLASLTIALSNSLGHTSFTSRMKGLKSQFPFIGNLQLRLLSSGKVTESVLQGESDVGVRFFRDEDTRLTYEEITREKLVIVCAEDSQWLTDADRLSEVPWVMLPNRGTILPDFLDQQLAQMGIIPRQKIEIDGFHSTKTMVAADFGLALLPYSHVQDDVEKGTLRILPSPCEATIPIYSVYRKNFHHADELREIVEFLFNTKFLSNSPCHEEKKRVE